MTVYPVIDRTQFESFLNTSFPNSLETPIWSLMGQGIPSLEVAMNPQTSDEGNIHEKTGHTFVEGYKPNVAVDQTTKKGEPIFTFIDQMIRRKRATLANAQSQLCNVWAYEDSYLNWYPAELQPVVLQSDKFGGDALKRNMHSFTISYDGDGVIGWFNPVTKVFEASPVLAGMTSIVIAGVTFTPVYDRNKLHYVANTTLASSVITVVAENVDAVILIKNGVTTITNGGAAATWVMGLNTLTVKLTVGDEIVTYTFLITKTA